MERDSRFIFLHRFLFTHSSSALMQSLVSSQAFYLLIFSNTAGELAQRENKGIA